MPSINLHRRSTISFPSELDLIAESAILKRQSALEKANHYRDIDEDRIIQEYRDACKAINQEPIDDPRQAKTDDVARLFCFCLIAFNRSNYMQELVLWNIEYNYQKNLCAGLKKKKPFKRRLSGSFKKLGSALSLQ